jgi:hypothetical protein
MAGNIAVSYRQGFAGQGRLIEKGYRQGGPAGSDYGERSSTSTALSRGVLNAASTRVSRLIRVILTLGPAEEVDLVREIYRAFVHQGYSESEIAADLNRRGISTDLGRPWTRGTVHQIHQREICRRQRMESPLLQAEEEARPERSRYVDQAQDAFAAVIERELFEAARTIISALLPAERRGDAAISEEALQQKGLLSGIVIDECDGMPSSSAYSSALAACFAPTVSWASRRIAITATSKSTASCESSIPVFFVRCSTDCGQRAATPGRISRPTGYRQRRVQPLVGDRAVHRDADRAPSVEPALRYSLAPDITIVVRMDSANRAPFDFYLFPASTCSPKSCGWERRMRASMPTASTASSFSTTSPRLFLLGRPLMPAVRPNKIEMIPISRITVLNPRARNKRQHREIVNNIEAIGLKRPITVSRRDGAGGPRYDLVCGEGRLEAFQMLGQTEIRPW